VGLAPLTIDWSPINPEHAVSHHTATDRTHTKRRRSISVPISSRCTGVKTSASDRYMWYVHAATMNSVWDRKLTALYSALHVDAGKADDGFASTRCWVTDQLLGCASDKINSRGCGRSNNSLIHGKRWAFMKTTREVPGKLAMPCPFGP
jgi:hypothetical protein